MRFPIRGKCCRCEQEKALPAMLQLPVKGPAPGKGWGCLQCNQPMDGAVAMICAECEAYCAENGCESVKWVCADYASKPSRVLRSECTEPFDHDMHFHPEEQERLIGPPRHAADKATIQKGRR